MSQNGNSLQRTISNSWSLLDFVRKNGGKLQIGEFTNKERMAASSTAALSQMEPQTAAALLHSQVTLEN